MLIPRFSVRWLLVITAVCAVLAFIVSLAVAGNVWAVAFSVMLAGGVLVFALYAAFFLIAWAGAEMWRKLIQRRQAVSPFATHTAPPQLVRPEEPD